MSPRSLPSLPEYPAQHRGILVVPAQKVPLIVRTLGGDQRDVGLLLEQKASLGDASWTDWLARHLPDVASETLSRYMISKLVTLASSSDGEGAASVVLPDSQNKQALIALGIIPSPENKRPSLLDPHKGWVHYVRFIDGFRKWFNKRIEDEPLETWDEQPRRLLKNELKWFAELYARL